MDGGKIAGLYDLGETLGRGHYAVVKQARHVFTGEHVAVKVIDKTKLDQVSRAHLFQEVRCMKLVQHPHVVRLYEVIDTQTKLYLILEFGDGGDMYDHIMRHDNGVSEDHARRYFGQILSAIIYCHKLHVVHRDLKPENVVFFDKLGVVKLTDFGFSNKFLPGEKLETSCGSLAYSAPEILLGDSYDAPKVDIWSLGVLLYMLVVGRAPFQQANDSETLTMIMDCKYRVPEHVSPQCKALIGKMLVRNPEKRATLEQIAADDWLKGLDLAQLATGPLVSREQLTEEEHQAIVHKMVQGNIASKEQIHEALEENTYNHITATYFLLAERKLRSTRLGVKTPTRGRKQMLAQPPRVAPGLPMMPQLNTGTTPAGGLPDVPRTGALTNEISSWNPQTGTTQISCLQNAPPVPQATNRNSTNAGKVYAGIPVVGVNDLQTTLTSGATTLTQPTATGLPAVGNNGGAEILAVPSRLARKCSIVKEGEEDESSATSPVGPKTAQTFSARTSATRVQIEELSSPVSEEEPSSLATSVAGGTVGGDWQMLSLPVVPAGSASQQQLCPATSSVASESMDADMSQQLSPAGQHVSRKLHAVKSSPQLLQSTVAAAGAQQVAGAGVGVLTQGASRTSTITGTSASARHRRLSCSSSENEDDEDPTFRRLERSKQEEDTAVESRRRDSIAAQINRERRASALSVSATPPVSTPENEVLPVGALNLSHLVRHDSVQFMDKSDSSSIQGVPSANSTIRNRSSLRESRKLGEAFFADCLDGSAVLAVPASPQIVQSKSLDASITKSISASITNNNNNNNTSHHQQQQSGKTRTKRLVDVKLASKCCTIC